MNDTRTTGLDSLGALTRWGRLLARHAACPDPAERLRMVERFPARDAALCIDAILASAPAPHRVEITGGRAPAGVRLCACLKVTAEHSRTTPDELMRRAIAHAAALAFPAPVHCAEADCQVPYNSKVNRHAQ